MRLLTIAGALLVLSVSAYAKDPGDKDADSDSDVEQFLSSTTSREQVTGAAPTILVKSSAAGGSQPTRAGGAKPGEGGVSDAQLGPAKDVSKEAAKAAPTLIEAAAPAGKPPIVFQHYKDVPQSTVAIYHKHLPFDGGPGTTYSIGFEAVHGDGGFLWCEGERNTFSCAFRAWFSLTPGGPALVDTFPKEHNFCKVDLGPTVYGNAWWATAAPAQKNVGSCHLKDGQRYYFNMQLVDWGPSPKDPSLFACDEYLDLAGDSTGDLWKQ